MNKGRHSYSERACVICNGPMADPKGLCRYISESDFVIAADGGARHLHAINVVPDVIIGDMDSIPPNLWKGAAGIEWIHADRDKDLTDAELAVDLAFDRGCRQVNLLAATGGRLDHTLGNISIVARHTGRVTIVDGDSTLAAISPETRGHVTGAVGSLISLLPYGAANITITTQGLKYALRGQSLCHATHGLSNQVVESPAYVHVSGGVVLLYVEQGGVERP